MSASLGISLAIVCFLVYPQADTRTDPLMATLHERAHIDAQQNRWRAWESKQKTETKNEHNVWHTDRPNLICCRVLPSVSPPPKNNCCRSLIIPHSKAHYLKLQPAKPQSEAGQNCMQGRKSSSVLVISKLGTVCLRQPSHPTNWDI